MKIIGEQKPVVGVTQMYSVVDDKGIVFTKTEIGVTYVWYIFKKQKNGVFVNVTKNNIPKTGTSVPYSFGYLVDYRLDVYKLEKDIFTKKDKASFVSSFFLRPTKKGSKAEIKKVVLYNKGAKKVDLAGIGNVLTVCVECINMANKPVKVHVWNAKNKAQPNAMNSKLIDINDKGIGTTQFSVTQLLSPTGSMDLMIGNKKAIGFYVTATYEEQSLTNKFPVVVVSQFQTMTEIFENARSTATYNDIDATETAESCEGKYCIKKGDENELIREVNIRLAGFGGNVPTDEFTDRTEKMIKQFQRDYMKVPETGKICGNVLKAIDEFQSQFSVDFNELKCKCGKCSGFGNELYVTDKQNSKIDEAYRKYEYPGVHRSLLWGYRALYFYLSNAQKGLTYSIKCINSGYRCWEDNKQNKRSSTNHMGKAIDIHFNKSGKRTQILEDMEEIREKVIIPKMGAQLRWGKHNKFSLEPTRKNYEKEFIATTWIHFDVRKFQLNYLENRYFVKSLDKLNGKSIVQLAIELGFTNTCSCNINLNIQNNKEKKLTNRVDPKTLKTSQKGKDFIKDWEKFFNMTYDDSEGYATIGYGYLIAYKSYKSVTKSDIDKTEITWNEFKNGITEKRALELFNKKIDLYEKAIQRDIKVNLYQYEFDALVSLLFNTGQNFLNIGGKDKTETKIKKNINNELYEEGAKEFSDVTNGGTQGLVDRRKKEIEMFKKNIYDSAH
jgi:GH24 family phage-related lysozyme (muramidase)